MSSKVLEFQYSTGGRQCFLGHWDAGRAGQGSQKRGGGGGTHRAGKFRGLSALRRSDTLKVSAHLRAVSPYQAASLPLLGAAFACESKP